LDTAGESVRTAVVAAFAPADQSIVGLDANECPRPPAAVAMQSFHARNFHAATMPQKACCEKTNARALPLPATHRAADGARRTLPSELVPVCDTQPHAPYAPRRA